MDKHVLAAGVSDELRDEFGNVHFGMVAQAFGFSLATSLTGAGAYQVIYQEGGSWLALGFASPICPTSMARALTSYGFTWGDNPGDSINIMKGWDYAEQQY